MKISLIQIDSRDNKKENFQKSMRFLELAMKESPDVICLSEAFLYWGDEKLKNTEENENSTLVQAYKKFAHDNNVNIVLGSIAIKTDDETKATNTTLVIDRQGEIIHRYDKIYMFNVCRDDIKIKESDTTLPGKEAGFFELDGVKMGVGICYDIRYPEYFRELTLKGAEIIFLPANFRKQTGEIAWDVLTRARAIEDQVYFCACDQTGQTGVKERCGNSKIISFDGKIVEEIGTEEGIVTADLDLELLRKFRKEFPVIEQIKK